MTTNLQRAIAQLDAWLCAPYHELDVARTLLADLRARVAVLEHLCQNDPPGGQGGSTFDPPAPAEGPVSGCCDSRKFHQKVGRCG